MGGLLNWLGKLRRLRVLRVIQGVLRYLEESHLTISMNFIHYPYKFIIIKIVVEYDISEGSLESLLGG